jgi:DmsE family decaheme c-type cytochrome
MTCTDCHNPHHAAADHLLKRNTVNQLCWSCHAELRGPYLFEHAPVTEDCTLCHTAHGSIHRALLKKRPPLLCQNCHSQAGHPSLAFTRDGLPANNPSAFVVGGSCLNCHSQVHGSNHPSGSKLMR